MTTPRNTAADSTLKPALRPNNQVAAGAFSLLGEAIDTRVGGFESILFLVALGAATGTPTTLAVDAKLQEAVTGSGDWTDVVADGINTKVAITQRTAVNTQDFIAVDASRLKPKLRLVFTVAFTGGSTPAIGLQATAQMGGGVSRPPAHA